MPTSLAWFKWTDVKPINLKKCLQELDSSYVKFSFLNIDSFQWLQWFEVIIVWYKINLFKNSKFQLFVDCSHLCFDLFLARFWFSTEFSIYSRLLYFNPGWNCSCNCNFFQLDIPSWNFEPGLKSPYDQPFNQA